MVRLFLEYRQNGLSKCYSPHCCNGAYVPALLDPFDFHFLISIPIDRPNWQDWGGRWTRRNAFMRHLKTVLEELDIHYTKPIQPVVLPKGNTFYGPIMQSPPPDRHDSDPDMLGNAGCYQAGEFGRPSGPLFRSGIVSTF